MIDNQSTYNHSTAVNASQEIVWRTNISTPSSTSDGTPTIRFTTNVTSDCRIGVTDNNWTSLGSTRNCTTTGLFDQTCTLTTQDVFSYTQYQSLYVGCRYAGNSSLMTANSTSGALNVSYIGRAVQGYTLDGVGAAVPSARVGLYNQTSMELLSNTTSNASGFYQFLINVSPQNYFVISFDPINSSRASDCKQFINATT